MISFIVPFFNSEGTLYRCVNSILAQTEPDLEVLLIDDGSTDGSGQAADEYAAADSRVKVLHKANGGLSSARNRGLDIARGEYVLFVDADDWIEPDTCRILINENNDADICIFGRSTDSLRQKRKWSPTDRPEQISGEEALRRLITEGTIRQAVWDKMYRREWFAEIRFPEGYNYEEYRTTYKLLRKARNITLIPDILYHYVQYKGSISNTHSAKNRLDHWTACYELYCVFRETGETYRDACVRHCLYSAVSAWASLWRTDSAEREKERNRIQEIIRFVLEHRKEAAKYKLQLWAAVSLIPSGTRWSMFCVCVILWPRRYLKGKRLYPRISEMKPARA